MKPPGGPIVAIALEFGFFPEITPLNPRFVAGHRRLKLTLDIETLAGPSGLAAGMWEALRAAFPLLSRHRCGDHRTEETFAAGGHIRTPSRTDDVEIAHLLEHLVIDCQHEIAGMKSCSGVTCAYKIPRNRFDLFIESPGPDVSRLCVALAMALLNDLARGAPADPVYAGVVALARRFHRSLSDQVSGAAAARLLGDERRARRALEFLRDVGFIEEFDACVNFSAVPLYIVTGGLDLRSA